MNKKFYVTTAIDYTNDVIHIGHAYQKILADCLARYHRLIGDQTYFLTGTDEHGQKVEKKAKEKKLDPKKFVDIISEEDKKEWKSLNISYDRFIRTTDEDHKKFSQEFYKKVEKNGDIYKGKYEGWYCEGCEAYLDNEDLIDDKCPFHPTKKIQFITEESYFFRLSKYQDFLLNYIKRNPDFIIPQSKKNEIVSFIKRGLKDFSITRQNVSWGIPVPEHEDLTIYVWFDALINYLTYGNQKKIWPADVHVLGKDNQRFHAIYWPAMLKSAGYDIPKTILVHDFISLNGQKISKSLGNVIKPSELVKKYGTDGVRYFFLRYGPLTNDVDISLDKITKVYNSDLANGLGNLVARLGKLASNSEFRIQNSEREIENKQYHQLLKEFRFNEAISLIWQEIGKVDKYINDNEPWKLKDKELEKVLNYSIEKLLNIAYLLKPLLPETAQKIEDHFTGKKEITEPLFPRLKFIRP